MCGAGRREETGKFRRLIRDMHQGDDFRAGRFGLPILLPLCCFPATSVHIGVGRLVRRQQREDRGVSQPKVRFASCDRSA